jgi:hypothetical protein
MDMSRRGEEIDSDQTSFCSATHSTSGSSSYERVQLYDSFDENRVHQFRQQREHLKPTSYMTKTRMHTGTSSRGSSPGNDYSPFSLPLNLGQTARDDDPTRELLTFEQRQKRKQLQKHKLARERDALGDKVFGAGHWGGHPLSELLPNMNLKL